jgi:hypothetical protein
MGGSQELRSGRKLTILIIRPKRFFRGEIMKQIAALTVVVITLSFTALAQDNANEHASPPAQASCKFADGKSIKVDYSSPRMNTRIIYGGLVPFAQVWRTGANEATSFVTDTDLTISGKDIPAGSYTIFTVPDREKWTLIINKKTGEWGIPYKYEADELARVDMKVSKIHSPVENFTIGFNETGATCTINLDWETTRASAQFSEKK